MSVSVPLGSSFFLCYVNNVNFLSYKEDGNGIYKYLWSNPSSFDTLHLLGAEASEICIYYFTCGRPSITRTEQYANTFYKCHLRYSSNCRRICLRIGTMYEGESRQLDKTTDC